MAGRRRLFVCVAAVAAVAITLMCVDRSVARWAVPPGLPTGGTINENTLGRLIDVYRATASLLADNLLWMSVFAALGIVVLYTSFRGAIKIPILDLPLSERWVFSLVPLVEVALWIRFGYLLDFAIKSRATADYLICAGNGHSDLEKYALRTALNDSGFMDYWFYSFRVDHAIASADHFVGAMGGILFGSILAANHTTAVMMSVLSVERACYFYSPGVQPTANGRAQRAAVLMILIIYAVTHTSFYVYGRNPNTLQVWIAALLVSMLCASTWTVRPDRSNAHGQVAR